MDSVIIGQFVGKEALSSVGGSSSQIINFVVGFFTGLSAGASVVISQYFGAKDSEQLSRALHTAYAFSIVGGVLAGIVGIFYNFSSEDDEYTVGADEGFDTLCADLFCRSGLYLLI